MPKIKYKYTKDVGVHGEYLVDVYYCTECKQKFAIPNGTVPAEDDFEFCENCGLQIDEIVMKEGRKNG